MRSLAVPLALAALVALATVGGAVPVRQHATAVEQTVSYTPATDRLVVDAHALEYAGENVTAVTVVVNNTGSSLTGDVRVTLLDGNESVVARATESGIILSATGTTTVTVSLPDSYDPGRVLRVNATAAESL